MGNEISLQFRLTNTTTDNQPVNFNATLGSTTTICQNSQSPNQVSLIEQVDPCKNWVGQIEDKNIGQGLHESFDQRSPISTFMEIGKDISESQIENLPATEHVLGDEEGRGQDFQTQFISSNYDEEYEKKLKSIQQTLTSLDDSLHETRGLETEKSLRYSQLKTMNMSLQIDLDKANKRNKNMLNLFRQNAAEIGFGRLRTSSTLPEPLRKDVQRIWSQKYSQKC